MRETERMIMLNVIDNQWKDNLLSMDHLKEGIGLRGYGQKDPLVEYKKESYVLFQDMMDRIEDETIRFLFFMQRVEERPADQVPNVPHPELWEEEEEEDENGAEAVAVAAVEPSKSAQSSVMSLTKSIERKKEKELAAISFIGGESSTAQQPVLAKKTVGRNDLCPCGSGKKYKKCHGS
jgi:preprotein translocase subunit SecA